MDADHATQARVLEVVLRRLHGLAGDVVTAYPPGSVPPDAMHQLWAEVCDLVDRTRRSGDYAPIAHRTRRFITRQVNKINWLLFRAFSPVNQYRFDRLTQDRLALEYCLTDLRPEVAARAVRLSWIRRLILALRALYAYLSDVEVYQNISVEAISPVINGLVTDLERHAHGVLPPRPFPPPPVTSFEETSAALVAAGPFVV